MDYSKLSKEELVYRLKRLDEHVNETLKVCRDEDSNMAWRLGYMEGCLKCAEHYTRGKLDNYDQVCIARDRRDKQVQRQAAIQKQQTER